MDPDIAFADLFDQFDTLLMGRKTFRPDEGNGEAPDPQMFGDKEIFVFSRTLDPKDHPHVTIVGDRFEETVQSLRRKPGRDIWLFGGGQLFRTLAAAGSVDTVEVAVIPTIIGDGVPLCPPPARRTPLTLTGQRTYDKTGTVILEYAVTR